MRLDVLSLSVLSRSFQYFLLFQVQVFLCLTGSVRYPHHHLHHHQQSLTTSYWRYRLMTTAPANKKLLSNEQLQLSADGGTVTITVVTQVCSTSVRQFHCIHNTHGWLILSLCDGTRVFALAVHCALVFRSLQRKKEHSTLKLQASVLQ